jgi:AraC-like DNA-binding protein
MSVEAANNSEGRWSGYSPRPAILHSSLPSQWRGAEFQEVVRAPRGSFDLVSTDLGVSWVRSPVKIRIAGRGTTFEEIPRHPTFMPDGHTRGEWIGAGSSLVLFINASFVELAFHDKVGGASGHGLINPWSRIEYLLNVLRLDVISGSPDGPALGEFVIVQIFQHIFPGRSSEGTSSTNRDIDRVVERIHANLSKPLSLLDLAASTGMSVRHFCRAFRTATGCAPHEFIVKIRVQRARELLQRGDRSLIEVAESVGFSSQAHMATTFRKLLGVTPSHFHRRQVRYRRSSRPMSRS